MGAPKKDYLDRTLFPRGYTQHQYSQYRKAKGWRGVSSNAVQAALDSGRIWLNEHGLIDPDEADVSWENYTRPEVRDLSLTNATREEVEDAVVDGRLEEVSQSEAQHRKMMADMYIKEHDARLKEIAVQEAEKKLLIATEVEREIFDAVRITRDRLLTIPARVAGRVASETDEKKIERMIEKEIRQLLKSLASSMEKYSTNE